MLKVSQPLRFSLPSIIILVDVLAKKVQVNGIKRSENVALITLLYISLAIESYDYKHIYKMKHKTGDETLEQHFLN